MFSLPLPLAIISDVHGNLEALQAIFQDIESLSLSTILNLGDTVGYGPDSEACIDLVAARCTLNLCGNHDYAVLHDAEGFNPIAKAAVDAIREVLRPPADGSDPERERRWRFLDQLETMAEFDRFEAMHGSPRQPITEYILPSDPEMDPMKLRRIFAAMSRPVAFVGHTHFPGVVEEGGDFFLLPPVLGGRYRITERRAIINVGSVGQPRDRDHRACYVVFDGTTVEWRRVPYDIETTLEKIRRHPGLHEMCGLRLREGR